MYLGIRSTFKFLADDSQIRSMRLTKIYYLKIASKFLYFSKKHDICSSKNHTGKAVVFQIKVSKIEQMKP